MKEFMDENFLLSTPCAQKLYHDYASKMPIVDYHCHINPKEIWEDRRFENIAQIWLGGDHYKWRIMRAAGVEEKYITGDAPDKEKFIKYAECLPLAIGNPLFHWSHLELKQFFDYDGVLSADTAEEVWNLTLQKLSEEGMSARGIIKKSNVSVICTTDDPIDSLEYHKRIAEDKSFDVKVLPTFRPDRALSPEKPDYLEYLEQLSTASGIKIKDLDSLCEALINRLDYFVSVGCKISDHGLYNIECITASKEDVESIFQKIISGCCDVCDSDCKLTGNDIETFRSYVMIELGKAYNKRDIAMQLHYGVVRNNNTAMHEKIGVDAGFDCITSETTTKGLLLYLDELSKTDELPKTIVYSLNPIDNAAIVSAIGCFQSSKSIGHIQHGSAWWFNDHIKGMKEQMENLCAEGVLGTFIGMLTDSRSFLSYPRFEYFRRILCELVGSLVENGEYPNDEKLLKRIIEGISYDNAMNYFGF